MNKIIVKNISVSRHAIIDDLGLSLFEKVYETVDINHQYYIDYCIKDAKLDSHDNEIKELLDDNGIEYDKHKKYVVHDVVLVNIEEAYYSNFNCLMNGMGQPSTEPNDMFIDARYVFDIIIVEKNDVLKEKLNKILE